MPTIMCHVKVLEVVGCRSSVVRALVAKARVPGFDSPVTTKIFFSTFFICFSLDPFKRESFNLVFMKGQNLIML